MTDQPKHGSDETPEGYRPPSNIPSQEPAPPAPAGGLSFEKPDYGQQEDYGTEEGYGAQSQTGEQYGQPSRQAGDPYNPSTSPYPAAYGAPTQPPFGQPGQPYAGQPYGQPGSPYNPNGQPAYFGVPPEPKGLSIASLCCGVASFVGLGFFILPQIAAVILGHLALRREPSGKGMAIAGLVLGYVAIALTALIIVIISLVASAARNSGSGA